MRVTDFVLLFVSAYLTSTSLASECVDKYHGHCHSMSAGCNTDGGYSFNYCGFLQMCCFGNDLSGSSSNSVNQTASTNITEHCGLSRVNPSSHQTKIVGGSEAQHGEFPWQVSLRYDNSHMCGGTLIDENWVLTAAHCLTNTHTHHWSIAIGVHDQLNIYRSSVHNISKMISHNSFNDDHHRNDIALMKLATPVDLTRKYQNAVCLPGNHDNFDHSTCTVVGWGSTHYSKHGSPGTRFLHKVNVPVIDNHTCRYFLGRAGRDIHEQNICALATHGGKDACQGDSGGPLLCKKGGYWKIAGIVSWGFGCGERNSPGIYTRVSSYLDWIHHQQKYQ